ncbi:MAG TPA: mechanosensitive ion channel family protein [Lacunisphaera sp.]
MTPVRSPSFRELFLPALLLLAFSLAWIYEGEIMRAVAPRTFGSAQGGLDIGLQIGLWLAAAYFIFSVIRVLVLDGVMAGAIGGPTPHLLRDVIGLVMLALAVTGIARFVFGWEITAFWATSGAVGLVIGLALRPVILDVFSGLTINLDRSYRIGDWLDVENGGKGAVTGEVVEINWRATRLKTVEGNLVLVPNSQMGTRILTNYSRPRPYLRQTVTICLDYSIPVERVRRVLLGALQAAIHPDGPLAEPAATVMVEGTSELGVIYRVDYWQVDHCGPTQARSRVLESALHHLHVAGITPAYPKRDNFTAPMPARQFDGRAMADRLTLMRRIDLFASLPDERLQALATGLVPRLFAAGDIVVRRGEAGESMFVLMEGLLEVRTDAAGQGTDQPLAVIQPGEFLGEMSLLTGEPRMATVRALTDAVAWEVTKAQMEPVLRSDPAFAAVLARVLAERQAKNARAQGVAAPASPHHTEHTAREILSRIVAMFRGVYDSLSGTPFHSGSRPPQAGESKPAGSDRPRQSGLN